jgi:hypothetical protein
VGRSWGFLASFSPIVRFGSPPGGQLTGAGYIPAPAQRGAIASRNSWICRIAGAIAAFSSGRLEQHHPNRPGFPILGLSCFVLALVSTPSYYDFGLVEVIAGGAGNLGKFLPAAEPAGALLVGPRSGDLRYQNPTRSAQPGSGLSAGPQPINASRARPRAPGIQSKD